MKHFGAYIADQGTGGSMINITSTTVILVPVKHAAYSGSKAGINFVTKIAAVVRAAGRARESPAGLHLRCRRR